MNGSQYLERAMGRAVKAGRGGTSVRGSSRAHWSRWGPGFCSGSANRLADSLRTPSRRRADRCRAPVRRAGQAPPKD